MHWGFWLYFWACLTDYLDGFYAKFFQETSSFGAFLDPLADKILVLAVLGTLVGLHRIQGIHLIPAGLIVFRELGILTLRSFLNFKSEELKVLPLARWKTACQMLAIGAFLFPAKPLEWMILPLGYLLLWVGAFFSLVTAKSYLQKSFALFKNKESF
jgi:cardiolipin synthase (CMP-forming)